MTDGWTNGWAGVGVYNIPLLRRGDNEVIQERPHSRNIAFLRHRERKR